MQSGQKSAVRIVLDTNVMVSGLAWQGATARLLDLALHGDVNVDLLSSAALLAEFRNVVTRRKFVKKLTSTSRVADDLIEQYIGMVRMVAPADVPPTVREDPADDAVLAAAAGGDAHLIVTGDDHLLKLRRFRQILIVRCASALTMLGGPKRRSPGRSPPKGGRHPRRL